MTKIFEQVYSDATLVQIYSDVIDCIQNIENLIYKHFDFLFSEQLKESAEDDLSRFDMAVKAFRNEYINYSKMLETEKQRVDDVKENNGIIASEIANKNVDRINNHLQTLQSAGDEIGKEMNAVYNDVNNLSKSINELHKSLPKRPPLQIRLISFLKSKFKI